MSVWKRVRHRMTNTRYSTQNLKEMLKKLRAKLYNIHYFLIHSVSTTLLASSLFYIKIDVQNMKRRPRDLRSRLFAFLFGGHEVRDALVQSSDNIFLFDKKTSTWGQINGAVTADWSVFTTRASDT